jgi:hypothetical protein
MQHRGAQPFHFSKCHKIIVGWFADRTCNITTRGIANVLNLGVIL